MVLVRRVASLAALALIGVWTFPVWSQGVSAPSLTPEQQRLLRNLPASQREALARRYLGLTPSSPTQAPISGVDNELDPDYEPPEELEEEIPTFAAGDTVVLIVTIAAAEPVDPDLATLKQKMDERNPYVLDDLGGINLPGIRPVALAGLNEEQARLRLNTEPMLADLEIEVFRLPVVDGPDIEYFGYNFFESDKARQGDRSLMPLPRNYVMGPGDTVRISMFGNTAAQYELQIDRDGALTIPELGPITVAGMTLEALRTELDARASRQLIGTEISVTLDELRSVRVFLVGDVKRPGAYTVSPFSTMTGVLIKGGGVAKQGSLRRIELKRRGRVVSRLDLYDLLLKGDVDRDRRIADGDVVFVPPVGPRVTISGEVRRPAVYELNGPLTVSDALTMAGGVTATGIRPDIRIERLDPEVGLSVLRAGGTAGSLQLAAGDVLVVPGESPQLDRAVSIQGHVYQRGLQEWRPGVRLTDILGDPRDLRSRADLNYVLLVREPTPNGEIEVFSADLEAAWQAPGSSADPVLQPRDEVTVFSLLDGRRLFLEPILDRLRQQAGASRPMPVVRISGEVKFPGDYPLEKNMVVADLVRAAGGLMESAYTGDAELTRYVNSGRGQLNSELISVELVGLLDDATPLQKRLLQPFDSLNVKRIPDWGEERFIELSGEVAFPGRYSIARRESLSNVIKRAGGLTDEAFEEGIVFTRKTLRMREQEQIAALTARMESDLAAMALSDPGQADAANLGRSLITQLRSVRPTGRLVIELDALLRGEQEADVLVRDGDALFVPKASQEVTVIGEVQYPTSHLWQRGLVRDDYVERSGGLTVKADRKRVYVVRANGEVVVGNGSQFFSRSSSVSVRPGDTVVVPINTDRVAPLVLWSNATQILYNLAIAAAAANAF